MRQVHKERFAQVFTDVIAIKTGSSGRHDAACDRLMNNLRILSTDLDPDHMNYANIETAMADLFINNNRWAKSFVIDMLDEARRLPNSSDGVWTDEQFVKFTFEDMLKEWFEKLQESMMDRSWRNESSFSIDPERGQRWKDIALGLRDIGSLHRVAWSEVAKSQMSE